MFDGLLVGLAEGANFASIAPEAMIPLILLLDMRIIVDVGGKESLRLSGVAIMGDLTEGASEFVLTVFAGNVSAVARDLGAGVGLTHYFYNFLMEISKRL
jgi:hypothetical protein